MKVLNTVKETPPFTPVKVTIEFISQAELDLIGTLSNYSDLVDVAQDLYEVDITGIRDGLKEAGADIHKTFELHQALGGKR